MTMTNQDSSVSHQGNAATTVFPFTFLIPTGTLEVTLLTIATNIESDALVEGVDYSVTGLDTEGGGNVTYPLIGSPLAATMKINIKRILDIEQTLDLTNQSAFLPNVLEAQLDRFAMIMVQLNDAISRALLFPTGSTSTEEDLLNQILTAGTDAAASAASAAASAAAAATFNPALYALLTGPVFTGRVDINKNSAGMVTVPSSTLLHMQGASNSVTASYFDSFGSGQNFFMLRRAKGTAAVPTAMVSGDVLGTFGWAGYDGTSYSANSAGEISAKAAEAWTSGAHGTELLLRNTLNGQTGARDAVIIRNDGSVDFLYGQQKFPAAQNASSDANTLDDYEEGSFTPRIDGTTAAGAGTYTTQVGKYCKIGSLVTFDLEIVWTAHTGTGNMKVANLPFTNGARKNTVALSWSNLTFANPLHGYVEASATTIALLTAVSAGAEAALAIDAAATLRVHGSYMIV